MLLGLAFHHIQQAVMHMCRRLSLPGPKARPILQLGALGFARIVVSHNFLCIGVSDGEFIVFMHALRLYDCCAAVRRIAETSSRQCRNHQETTRSATTRGNHVSHIDYKAIGAINLLSYRQPM